MDLDKNSVSISVLVAMLILFSFLFFHGITKSNNAAIYLDSKKNLQKLKIEELKLKIELLKRSEKQ